MKTQRSIYVLVTLMSIALVVLIGVQYVWLGSAVKIKADEFDRNVLTAMRATSVAMEEKNTLKFLSQKLKNDSLVRENLACADSGFVSFVEGTNEENEEESDEVKTIAQVTNENGRKRIVVQTRTEKGGEKNEETEIQYGPLPPPVPLKERREKFISIMCSAADEYSANADNWKEKLDSVLLNKTIHQQFDKFHLPADFAFAVLRSDDDSIFLSNKENVKPKAFKYKAELIGFDFSGKGLWLFVDFPSRFKYVFVSLAGMFALSLVFSGVIIVVFVLALRLIFRQKKLNEITNDFINNMTHEFKTPLATISMTADTLHLDNVNDQREQVKEYATMIKEEAGKLSRHVDRILEAASQEKRKTETTTVADLKKVIQTQLQLHENVFIQTNASVKVELPEGEVTVTADEENLGYVVSNLLDNAVKYSKGNPEITINVHVETNNVLLKVEDKGIGISKEDRKMVFEKFFRTHTGNRHDVKGFGLGLSFVKNMVETWGGKVWVESQQSEGSAFFVEVKRTNR